MQREGAGCGGARRMRTYDASAKFEGRSRVIAPPYRGVFVKAIL